MKKKNKILRWIFIPIILLIILLLAVSLALQNPKVQTHVARYFTNSLSKKLDTKVTVDGVDIDFFTEVNIDNFYIEDKKGDTLFFAGTIHSKAIKFAPFKNTFLLSDSRLSDVVINIHRGETDSLSNLDKLFVQENSSASGKKQKRNRNSLNLSFDDAIIENFDFELRDSLSNQATDVELPLLEIDFERFSIGKKMIKAKKLHLHQPYISMVKTEFSTDNETDTSAFTTPKDWLFAVDDLTINDGEFVSIGTKRNPSQTNQFMFGNFSMNDLQLQANQVKAENNRLDFAIHSLSFTDETGFTVEQLESQAWLSDTELGLDELVLVTPNSRIKGDILFSFNYLSDFSEFETNVRLNTNLENVELAPKDFAYLFGSSPVREKIYLNGHLYGRVNNLDAENFQLRFAHGSLLRGNIHARGLPDLENTFFDARIDQLSTTQSGLRRITGEEMPEKIQRFGDIQYNGDFIGYLDELVSYGTIRTDIGSFDTDVKFSNQNDIPQYSGYIASDSFNIGYWLDNNDLGNIDFSASVQGRNFDLTKMNTDFEATINAIEYQNSTYNNLSVEGNLENETVTGVVNAKDQYIDGVIDGSVNFANNQLIIDFDADINQADLHQLNIVEDPLDVKGKISASLSGRELDELKGKIDATNASITTNKRTVQLEEAAIRIEEIEGQESITITTGTIDANFRGEFKYTELVPTTLHTINTYYDFNKGWEDLENTIDTNEQISFTLNVNEQDKLLETFIDGLVLDSDIEAEGYINPATQEISVVANTDYIGWDDFAITDWQLDALGTGDVLIINSFQEELYNLDKKWLVDSELTFELSGGNEILADIRTYNESFLAAKLTSRLRQLPNENYEFSILSSDLIINEEEWEIDENNSITFGEGNWDAENFILSNGEQRIEIYNPAQDLDTKLIANIENLELEDINELIGFTQKPFGGQLTGKISLIELQNELNIDASVNINSFMYNTDVVDVVTIDGIYNLDEKQGNFEGVMSDPNYQAGIDLNLNLNKNDDIIDLTVDLYRASLSPFGSLWSDSIEDLSGFAEGQMNIVGGPNTFNLFGDITLVEDLELTLAFTQARYTIPQGEQINIERNSFNINEIIIQDPYGNQANVSGSIEHNDLSDFRLNINGNFSNFLLLNTTEADNEVFYGTAFADGSISFNGPIDDALMNVSATSKPNTEIYIASSASQNTASEYSFIRFKQPETDSLQQAIEQRNQSNLTMQFDLDINSNANVHMSFDDADYNTLRGNGFGNLTINIDTQDLFEIIGFYQINSGAYIINYENILQREFNIRPGGIIQWSGDPYSARLNIDAVYTLAADVSALLQDGSELSGDRGSKVETEIIVTLSQTLEEPQFTYQINVASATTGGILSEQVRLINNNESLLESQLFSLLALERFSNNNSNPFAEETDLGNLAFNSLTTIFARQLTSLLAEVEGLENTQIGIDYENYRQSILNNSGDVPGGLDQQVQLQLSQQLADNIRLKVGSDFNFGENLDPNRNAFAVGDIVLEIDLNKDGNYEIILFSRQDYNILVRDNLRRNGISYRFEREFDSFSELFNKKEEEAIQEEENNPLNQFDEDSEQFQPREQNRQNNNTTEPSEPGENRMNQYDEDSQLNPNE